jgi:3-deoxy-manno-octulosonate cytidylyltransferase (CMP-KDO synthetase)
MNTLVVIPSRYASTRFPGKPLALIHGKPMVQHVWEKCRKAADVQRVIVATEDDRIVNACAKFGAEAEMTSDGHASGTDRVAEVARRHPEFDVVLNVQGDEPGIPSETITAVVRALSDQAVDISTAVAAVTDADDLNNPNVVKAVTTLGGSALYFSRAHIPYHRGQDPVTRPTYYRHLGIYGFQRNILLAVTQLPVSPLERAESLEQLRWLQAGYNIQCVPVAGFSIGVDTPEDLQSVEISLRV